MLKEETMTQRQEYAATSRDFLAKAQAALDQGDLAQASEKAWGAAAQMVKAIAEQRGWQHNGHALLFQTVSRLVAETGDDQLRNLFHVANSLHSNFYENWLDSEMVESGLRDVRLLVTMLERLLS